MDEEVRIAQEKIERLVNAIIDGRAEAAQISEREIALAVLDPKNAQEKFDLDGFRKFLSVYDGALKNNEPQIVTEQSYGEFINRVIGPLGTLVFDCLSPFYTRMIDYANAKTGKSNQVKQETEKTLKAVEAKKEAKPVDRKEKNKQKREKSSVCMIIATIAYVLSWVYSVFAHVYTAVLVYAGFGTVWCVLSLISPVAAEVTVFFLQFIFPGILGGYWILFIPMVLGFVSSVLCSSADESEGGKKVVKIIFGVISFILFLAIAAFIIWAIYMVVSGAAVRAGILVYN